jgi:hypothetical protein
MINRSDFLESIDCRSGRIAKEINELIFNWHKLSGLNVKANYINDSIYDDLKKAALFWKNLVLSEAEGFRDSIGRLSFHKLLKEVIDKDESINYFGILCPSYKKGIGVYGFADKPGNTTYRAFANLMRMVENTKNMGIKCDACMFFADISVENYEKLTVNDFKDFQKIIELDLAIAESYKVKFSTLTQKFPELLEKVGIKGKQCDLHRMNVSEKAFKRSLWRDRQFYPKNFGWSIEKADQRTITHAHSYFYQGESIRGAFNYPVMVYSAYDYEKAGLYNGKEGDLWPAIIFPIKDESNPPTATISAWNI